MSNLTAESILALIEQLPSDERIGHEVTLQTGDRAFQSLVYFANYPGLQRNLLGRQGWLRNLRLGLIDYDNLLYLSAYNS